MNDVIAPKRSSLRPGLVEATMFLKPNMSLILENLADVVESLIWNTLIPNRLELLDDINEFDDYENEEGGDDDDDEDEDLSLVPIENEEADHMCSF